MKAVFTPFLALAVVAIFAVQQTHAAGGVTVTGSGGAANNSYSTLKAAFDALNLVTTQAGNNIVITISASTTETATASLNQPSVSSWASLTIYPTVSGLTIGSAYAGPVITLNGADNVTINGSLNGANGGTDLTIASTAQQAILFQAGASSNTVKYCTLKGSYYAATGGRVIEFVAGTGGNNNNAIDNNNITNGGTRVTNALYAVGSSGNVNTGNMIRNNNFYDHLYAAANSSAVNLGDYNSGWTISGNSFYETGNIAPADLWTVYFIYIPGATAAARGTGFTITGNYFGGTAPQCGGTALTKTANRNALTCIYLNAGTGTASNVLNNTIRNISWTNGTTMAKDVIAIYIANGDVNVGSTAGTGNVIGPVTYTAASSANYFYGINIQSINTVNCNYNEISQITTASSDPAQPVHIYGIYKYGDGTISISNNTVGSSTGGTASLNATSTATGVAQMVLGIYISGSSATGPTTTVINNTVCGLSNGATNALSSRVNGIVIDGGINTVTGNTVANLASADNNSQLNNLASVVGIIINAGSVNGAQNLSGNSVSNLSNSHASFAGALTGIYFCGRTNATYPSTVSGNFLRSFSVSGASSTAGSIIGIRTGGGTTAYSNNIISLGGTSPTTLYGIYNYVLGSTETSSFYFNTVYIGGSTASGTTNKSYAMYLPTTMGSNFSNFRNNIFTNARSTTGGASLHYAFYLPLSAATNYNIDYNDYYVSGSGGVAGYYNSLDQSILPLVTLKDANSVLFNPQFASAGGSAASDYLPSAPFLAGVAGTGVTTDYTGTTRTWLSMGAYEYNMVTGVVHVQATAGTASVNYGTLAPAFTAINNGVHQGDITITLNSNALETWTASLYGIGLGSANYSSLLLYPTAAGLSISGNFNTNLLMLNGADNVVIDGRVNQSGAADLVINNPSTGNIAATVKYINDAKNNTIRYCTIKGSTSQSTAGVVYFSTSLASGNTGNTIDHCNITTSGATLPLNLIYSYGTTPTYENIATISNNNLYDFSSKAIYAGSLAKGWTITGNSIYSTIPFTIAGAIDFIKAAGDGYTISGNYIGGTAPNCGGTPLTVSTTYSNLTGIYLAGLNPSTAVSNIYGNTISNITATTTSGSSFIGINCLNGEIRIGSLGGNTIGSGTGTGNITLNFNVPGSAYTSKGIALGSSATGIKEIKNNVIGAVDAANSGTTASSGHGFIAIDAQGTGNVTISGNTIGSTVTANSINCTNSQSAGAGTPQEVLGISISTTGSHTVTDNTVANLHNSWLVSTTGGKVRGILTTGTTTTETITGNTIYGLSSDQPGTGTTSFANIIGIEVSAASAATSVTVSGNKIYDLTNTHASFAGQLTGIYYYGPTLSGTYKLSENYIRGLAVTGASSTAASLYGIYSDQGKVTLSNNIVTLWGDTPTTLYGIYDNANSASGLSNIWFNTVYIGGNPAAGTTNKSYALYRANTVTTVDYRDNILSNFRATSGGSNLHYAAYLSAASGTLTLNYNDYYAPGTGGVQGYYGANKTALPLATGKDANSLAIDPSFTSAGGVTADDYRPVPNTYPGVTVATVPLDYGGATRGATPTIGAYEWVPPCINPTDPGSIAASQASLVPFTPEAFTSVAPTGHSGTLEYKWQQSTVGATTGFSDIASSNSETYAPGEITLTTWFRRYARVGCKSDWTGAVVSNVLKITIGNDCADPTDGGTIAAAQTLCAGSVPEPFTSLTAPSGHSGTLEYKWQQSVTGSSSGYSDIALSNAETYAPGALAATTWYRRLARVACSEDWSGAVASNVLQVTVNQPSFVGTTRYVSDLQATGENIKWYTTPSGGTALATNTVISSGHYYASQTVNGVESSSRLDVTVSVENTPCKPAGSSTQTFASGATVASLAATGTNIRWYTAASGGTALPASTLLTDGTHYFASQTVSCTESASRLEVTVTVTP